MTLSLRNPFLVGALAFATLAHGAELVTNGGFETGDFTGFSLTGNSGDVSVLPGVGTGGGHAVDFANVGTPATLTQTIATVVGDRYTFSFDAYSFLSGVGNLFDASFGDQVVVPATTLPNASDYAHFSFDLVADSTSTSLAFDAFNNPSGTLLDNVSVVPRAVPEPSALAALGLGALGVLRRRKRA